MALTEPDLAYLRAQLGTVDQADAETRLRRLGDVRMVAVEILRERRATLVADPLTVTVQGVATVNNAENVRALERQIADISATDTGTGAEFALPVPIARRRTR
ncbi:hypothetical protein ACFWXK_38210 [Streptomyces sp. NPDC059070]|uniref:hypothetical protein n=1 Tax=Streptomyces sp. NPDC059070 TaxID=3346713 RepID=UPI0036C2F197